MLQNNGLEAKIIGLSGHVVTTVRADGKWLILDADLGIVMPYSLEEVEQDRNIVESYYKNTWNPELFVSIYTSANDNVQIDSARAFSTSRITDFEETAYQYKWMVPLGLMFPFTLVKMVRTLRYYPNLFKRHWKNATEESMRDSQT